MSGIFDDPSLDNLLAPTKEDNLNYFRDTYEQALNYAQNNNLEVIHPKKNEIQLDLDTDAALAQYNEVYPLFSSKFSVMNNTRTVSKSGKTHIVIEVAGDLTNIERLALQAALGSDGKREILSYVRYKKGEPWPSLLFEVKKTEGANS